jgi:hypothetical protein
VHSSFSTGPWPRILDAGQCVTSRALLVLGSDREFGLELWFLSCTCRSAQDSAADGNASEEARGGDTAAAIAMMG